MKFIIYINIKNGKVDLNNTNLHDTDLGMNANTPIKNLTNSGYLSKKELNIDLFSVDRVQLTDDGKIFMEITDSEYSYLKENFAKKPKHYSTWKGDGKATAILELCKRMHDPYDVC